MYKLCFHPKQNPSALSQPSIHPSTLPHSPACYRLHRFALSVFSIHPSPPHTRTRLLEEDVVQRCNNRDSNHRPASSDNLLVREPNTKIPHQMPNTIERVEEHWEREEALERNLRSHGPGSDRRDHARGLEVPARVRRGEVCEAEKVERARQSDARDSVQGRGVPGDLGAVDGKMGRDGAVETLLGEDFGGSFLGCRFGGCEPGDSISRGPEGCG